jgi:hypothetical protein
MKNFLFTLFFVLCLVGTAFAQSTFMISPNPADTSGTPLEYDLPADAHIINLTSNTLNLKWERTVITLTAGCQTQVCDPFQCYFPGVNSKNFSLTPNQTDDMIVHFLNGTGSDCCGLVRLKVTNLDNPNDTLSALYYLNPALCGFSVGTKNPYVAQANIFPNPTADFFAVKNAPNLATIRVMTLDGRETARYEATSTNRYFIGNQNAGTYILILEDAAGKILGATELVKQ